MYRIEALRNRHFFFIDLFALLLIPLVALILRLDILAIPPGFWLGLISYTILALVVRLLVFRKVGLYARFWRYASLAEAAEIIVAVLISTAIISIITLIARAIFTIDFARSVLVIDALLTLMVVGGSRFSVRYISSLQRSSKHGKRRVLIMGAGDAGEMVIRELQRNSRTSLHPIGFLDDDPKKQHIRIHDLPVLGSRKDIPHLAAKHHIDQIIVAIPRASGEVIREIKGLCDLIGIEAKITPSLHEILDGRISLNQIRDVQIEDLLRRKPVQTDIIGVRSLIAGKRVLITGGGGSIGSELCRQLLTCAPSELIILGHGENSVFEIYHDLKRLGLYGPKLTPIIADVRFPDRLHYLFEKHKPQVIFHAAAHKHVPLMESHPVEAISNNVLGTRNLLDAALAVNVERFVMVSTDKAVSPTNVMGASKRVAELLVHQAAQKSGKAYVAVRFGNVLGSRGSVVLTFKKQIMAGGPVTVTHPDVTRYFMTIPEAVQLVLQASVLGTGGEAFVLDMGEPIKILDLATDLIRLSGLEVGRDIEIKITGLRPGDKLFEELFLSGESYDRTDHRKIFTASNAGSFVPHDLETAVDSLIAAAQRHDFEALTRYLKNLVPGYRPMQSSEPAIETEKPETAPATPLLAEVG